MKRKTTVPPQESAYFFGLKIMEFFLMKETDLDCKRCKSHHNFSQCIIWEKRILYDHYIIKYISSSRGLSLAIHKKHDFDNVKYLCFHSKRGYISLRPVPCSHLILYSSTFSSTNLMKYSIWDGFNEANSSLLWVSCPKPFFGFQRQSTSWQCVHDFIPPLHRIYTRQCPIHSFPIDASSRDSIL